MINIKHCKSLSLLSLLCSLVLIGCNDGDTNSGGPTPVVPLVPLYSVGVYTGTAESLFEGNNIVDNSDEPYTFGFEVRGSVAGSQQVRIAYREFSGTSSILPDGSFSIPTGRFRLQVRDRNGVSVAACEGRIQYDGTFSTTNAASGTITTIEPFVCDDSRLGPITETGTFQVNFGRGKALITMDDPFVTSTID